MVVPGLKARYVDVYLPSEAAKQEWEEEANKAGLTLSKFVFGAVEAFRAAKDETPATRWSKSSLKLKRRHKSFALS